MNRQQGEKEEQQSYIHLSISQLNILHTLQEKW